MKYRVKDLVGIYIRLANRLELNIDQELMDKIVETISSYGEFICRNELERFSLSLIGDVEILGYITNEILRFTTSTGELSMTDELINTYTSLACAYYKNSKEFETRRTNII